MTKIPTGPWQELSVDFAEVAGHNMLIVVDDHSTFPFVEVLHSTVSVVDIKCDPPNFQRNTMVAVDELNKHKMKIMQINVEILHHVTLERVIRC